MKDLVGLTLSGRYRVDKFIDRGGMATVYRAFDLQRGIPLAMKVLNADLAEDVVFLRRFRREAVVLQRLDHPNIVRFHSFEQFDRLACLFMEFVDGDTLRGRVHSARGPLPAEELRYWLRPICTALSYAHGQGVFHCDIKPANIMVASQGRVVVSDFGIARTVGGTVTTMSRPGTPDYMAPEQWLGRKLDARTDIYALGITLFAMVTGGERPFTGDLAPIEDTLYERLRWEHLNLAPPSPRQYNPALSEGLASLILKALAKNPADRFPTAQTFYQGFEEALAGRTAYPPPAPPKPPSPPLPPLVSVGPELAPAVGPEAMPPIVVRKPVRPGVSLQTWGIFTVVAGVIIVLGLVLALAAGGGGGGSISPTATQPSSAPQPTSPSTLAPVTPTPQPTIPLAPPPTTPAPPPTNPTVASDIFIEYILSSANGMMQPLDGGSKRDAARNVLTRHWQSLRPEVNVGLRVYGHRYSAADESASCMDTQLLVSPGVGQIEGLIGQLGSLEARGMAPVKEALYAAAGDFNFPGPTNAIILIADSADNCGQDPCALIRTQVHDAGLPLTVYVIGLGVEGEDRAQLACIADSSNGLYRDAADEETLHSALDEIATIITRK